MGNCVESQRKLKIHTNTTSENKLNGKTIYHGTKNGERKNVKAMNCRIGYKQQPEPNPANTKRTLRFFHVEDKLIKFLFSHSTPWKLIFFQLKGVAHTLFAST